MAGPDVTQLVRDDHVASTEIFAASVEQIRIQHDDLRAQEAHGEGIERAARFHDVGIRRLLEPYPP